MIRCRHLLRSFGAPITSRISSSGHSGRVHLSTSAGEPELPPFPECDFEPEPYAGRFTPTENLEKRRQLLSGAMRLRYREPLLLHRGHMQWMWDASGRRYLDLFASVVTISAGHCHPRVTRALQRQAEHLWHPSSQSMHPAMQEFADELVRTLPEPLSVCFFVNSGSEANDMALLLARLYTGREEAIALRYSYHGISPYALSLSNMSTWRPKSGLHTQGSLSTMNPDPYAGPWGGAHCRDSLAQTKRSCSCGADSECEATSRYVDQLRETIDCCTNHEGPAAFIAEGIQGAGGMRQFTRGYIRRAYELVRSRGGLCIADEVQTGVGRIGTHFWGFESHGVVPDIVTMAKGIGNGFPVAAVVTTPEIAPVLARATHFNTFGGNPLACAVGASVLQTIKEEQLQQHIRDTEPELMRGLLRLRDRYPDMVGDVRGRGFMLGLELVAEAPPLDGVAPGGRPMEPERVAAITETLRELGIVIGTGGLRGNVLRLTPPFCTRVVDLEYAVAALDVALHRARK